MGAGRTDTLHRRQSQLPSFPSCTGQSKRGRHYQKRKQQARPPRLCRRSAQLRGCSVASGLGRRCGSGRRGVAAARELNAGMASLAAEPPRAAADAPQLAPEGPCRERKPDAKATTPAACAEDSCFDCNICLELASDPVITLCGHLYCWPCLYRCGSPTPAPTRRGGRPWLPGCLSSQVAGLSLRAETLRPRSWLALNADCKTCPVCKAGVEEDKARARASRRCHVSNCGCVLPAWDSSNRSCRSTAAVARTATRASRPCRAWSYLRDRPRSGRRRWCAGNCWLVSLFDARVTAPSRATRALTRSPRMRTPDGALPEPARARLRPRALSVWPSRYVALGCFGKVLLTRRVLACECAACTRTRTLHVALGLRRACLRVARLPRVLTQRHPSTQARECTAA